MDRRAHASLASGSSPAGFARSNRGEKGKELHPLTHAIFTPAVKRPRRYGVFLSFCGQDTRKDFIGCLHEALEATGTSVFKDDLALTGEEIRTGLSRGINNSKIAIPVISKNYGNSESCLNELCQIMHRRDAEQGQEVLPVFYGVDVSDVHDRRGEFGEAFRGLARHRPSEVVKEWKGALRSLTKIKGWSWREDANGDLGELVKMVVKKVSSILSPPWIEQIPIFGKKRREGEYDVFPICSPTTKKSWTSYLRNSLMRKKISVFSNEDSYLIGKDFACEVCKAMRHCKIFIPIISEDFASSPDCLNSLVYMVKCIETNGSKILPIFYEVDPSGSKVWVRFREDMRQHNVEQYTRQQWQQSLNRVHGVGGLVSANIGNGNKGKLVIRAIKEVRKLLWNFNG